MDNSLPPDIMIIQTMVVVDNVKSSVGIPWRSDRFSVVVADTREISSVILTEVVDEMTLSNPSGMSKLPVVEVEVHPVVRHGIHCVGHRHLCR